MNEQRSEVLHHRLLALIDAVEGREPSESECEACQDLLPGFVEAEMAGERVSDSFPDVWRHLMVCEDCSALYADLLEITMLEVADELPIPESMPAPDLSFLTSRAVRDKTRAIARTILTRTMPESLGDFDWLIGLIIDRAEALGEGFHIRANSQVALAFGGEIPPSVPVIAATFKATQALLRELSEDEGVWESELDALIERTALEEARDLGLGRSEAKAFASEYVLAAKEHLAPPSTARGASED